MACRLEPLRRRIDAQRGALDGAGVRVEDKGASIALHYRLAPDREGARATIDALHLAQLPGLHVFSGKMVENVVAAGAPDKAGAMQSLVARCRADSAFFAGDDVNDEPVFVQAPPHWLTVRVGRDESAFARALLSRQPGRDVAVALQTMIDELDEARRG